MVELLVACSIEGKAPLREEHSLTHKLTTLLRRQELWESGFHISFLYNRLVHYQKVRGQVYLGDENERGVTPLRLSILSRREESRSICISRRKSPDSEEEEGEADTAGSAVRDSPIEPPLGSLAEITNPSQVRTLAVYSDAATNTESDFTTTTIPASSLTFPPPTPPSRARAVVEYVEAATNIETVVIAQNRPVPQASPSTAIHIRPRTPAPVYHQPSLFCEPSVRWRLRKRKMGDDANNGRHVI